MSAIKIITDFLVFNEPLLEDIEKNAPDLNAAIADVVRNLSNKYVGTSVDKPKKDAYTFYGQFIVISDKWDDQNVNLWDLLTPSEYFTELHKYADMTKANLLDVFSAYDTKKSRTFDPRTFEITLKEDNAGRGKYFFKALSQDANGDWTSTGMNVIEIPAETGVSHHKDYSWFVEVQGPYNKKTQVNDATIFIKLITIDDAPPSSMKSPAIHQFTPGPDSSKLTKWVEAAVDKNKGDKVIAIYRDDISAFAEYWRKAGSPRFSTPNKYDQSSKRVAPEQSASAIGKIAVMISKASSASDAVKFLKKLQDEKFVMRGNDKSWYKMSLSNSDVWSWKKTGTPDATYDLFTLDEFNELVKNDTSLPAFNSPQDDAVIIFDAVYGDVDTFIELLAKANLRAKDFTKGTGKDISKKIKEHVASAVDRVAMQEILSDTFRVKRADKWYGFDAVSGDFIEILSQPVNPVKFTEKELDAEIERKARVDKAELIVEIENKKKALESLLSAGVIEKDDPEYIKAQNDIEELQDKLDSLD